VRGVRETGERAAGPPRSEPGAGASSIVVAMPGIVEVRAGVPDVDIDALAASLGPAVEVPVETLDRGLSAGRLAELRQRWPSAGGMCAAIDADPAPAEEEGDNGVAVRRRRRELADPLFDHENEVDDDDPGTGALGRLSWIPDYSGDGWEKAPRGGCVPLGAEVQSSLL
jgi:hypothetical protein